MATASPQNTGPLFVCPGCKSEVAGVASIEFALDPTAVPDVDGTVVATARVTGLRVVHDCVPKVKRKHRATRVVEVGAEQAVQDGVRSDGLPAPVDDGVGNEDVEPVEDVVAVPAGTTRRRGAGV